MYHPRSQDLTIKAALLTVMIGAGLAMVFQPDKKIDSNKNIRLPTTEVANPSSVKPDTTISPK